MKRVTTLLSIIFFATTIFAQSEEEAANIVNKGDYLPDFTLSSTIYGTVSAADLKGKVTLITIFATWCPPCQKELKEIQEVLYPKYKDNADFCLLVVGREHTDQELTKYNEKKGFTFPLYPDPKREFTNKFATKFIPRTYVIDKQGGIAWASSGYKDSQFAEMMNLIEELLK